MSLVANLVLFKFIESLALIYANMRQKSLINRLHRVPLDLQFAYTLSDINESKDKAMRRVTYDVIMIIWDLILFSVACFSPGFFRRLWDLSKNPYLRRGDSSFQPTIFAVTMALAYWTLRQQVAVVFRHFVLLGKEFNKQTFFRLILDSLVGFISLMMDSLTLGLLVQVSISYYGSSSKLALASASFIYYLGSFLLFGPALHEPDDRPFLELPEGRLKARLLSLAAVFGLSPSQVLFADNWRSNYEEDGDSKGLTMRLVTTFYREESGGGHAKTYEIPEILAYAAHALSFYKNMFPLVMSLLNSFQTALRVVLAFHLAKIDIIYEEFGFSDIKPIHFGLFLNYYLILSSVALVYKIFNLYICRRFYRSGDRLVSTLSNGRHLSRALCKLDSINCVCPVADPYYTSMYLSKPPLFQRVRFLNSIMLFNNNN